MRPLTTSLQGDGQARGAGHAAIARLFLRTSQDEFSDHFLKLAVMAGIVGSNAQNLRDAISGEGSEATTIYPQFAAQASAQGDQRAADLPTELAGDEATHRGALRAGPAGDHGPVLGGQDPGGPEGRPVPDRGGSAAVDGRHARQPPRDAPR